MTVFYTKSITGWTLRHAWFVCLNFDICSSIFCRVNPFVFLCLAYFFFEGEAAEDADALSDVIFIKFDQGALCLFLKKSCFGGCPDILI